MTVPSSVSDLDPVAANNSPTGSEPIGTNLDDYLRSHAAIIRQVSNAKASSGVATASGLTASATDKILGRSSAGAGAIEEITCTSAGRALIDDADASAQRTTLGLGTAAVANTGTASGNVIALDGSAKIPAVDGSNLTNVNLVSTNGNSVGYGTGSGGAVTQTTSKSTAVTLNKRSGQITMNGAALAAGTAVQFTLNNSLLSGSDVLHVTLGPSGITPSAYTVTSQSGAGAANIVIRNHSAGSLSEAIVLNFVILQGSVS